MVDPLAPLRVLDPELADAVAGLLAGKPAPPDTAIDALVADTFWAIGIEIGFGYAVARGHARLLGAALPHRSKWDCLKWDRLTRYRKLIRQFGAEGPGIGGLMATHLPSVLAAGNGLADRFLTTVSAMRAKGDYTLNAPLTCIDAMLQEKDAASASAFLDLLDTLYAWDMSYNQSLRLTHALPRAALGWPLGKRPWRIMQLCRVARTDLQLTESFLQGMDKGLDLLRREGLEQYISEGLGRFAEDADAGRAFLELQSRPAMERLAALQVTVPLSQESEDLARYLRARTGRAAAIRPMTDLSRGAIMEDQENNPPLALYDGKTLYLIDPIDHLDSRQDNILLYKALAKLESAMSEYGTFDFDLRRCLDEQLYEQPDEKPDEQLDQQLDQQPDQQPDEQRRIDEQQRPDECPDLDIIKRKRERMAPPDAPEDEAPDLERLFRLFPLPALARDLYTCYEHGRLMRLLGRDYPGILRQATPLLRSEARRIWGKRPWQPLDALYAAVVLDTPAPPQPHFPPSPPLRPSGQPRPSGPLHPSGSLRPPGPLRPLRPLRPVHPLHSFLDDPEPSCAVQTSLETFLSVPDTDLSSPETSGRLVMQTYDIMAGAVQVHAQAQVQAQIQALSAPHSRQPADAGLKDGRLHAPFGHQIRPVRTPFSHKIRPLRTPFGRQIRPDLFRAAHLSEIRQAEAIRRKLAEKGLKIYASDVRRHLTTHGRNIDPETIREWVRRAERHLPPRGESESEKAATPQIDPAALALASLATEETLIEPDEPDDRPAFRYPEWDFRLGDYRINHVRLVEHRPPGSDAAFYEDVLARHPGLVRRIHRSFSLLKPEGLTLLRRWPDGDDFDHRALIDYAVDRRSGRTPSERIFIKRVKRRRDVAALLLVDLSRSTANPVAGDNRSVVAGGNQSVVAGDNQSVVAGGNQSVATGETRSVLDVQKDAIVLFCEALSELGDAFAVAGFSSVGRLAVTYTRIKDFSEDLTEAVKARIGAVTPMRNTRMGAAIRHAAMDLSGTPAAARVLILITDGFPNDADYKRAYAMEDTRKAILEARSRRIHTRAITVNIARSGELDALYGPLRHNLITDTRQLPDRLIGVYGALTRI